MQGGKRNEVPLCTRSVSLSLWLKALCRETLRFLFFHNELVTPPAIVSEGKSRQREQANGCENQVE